MANKIKNWFNKKITLILAPSRGSRSFHLHLSYPFFMFLIILGVLILSAGFYFSKIYSGYLIASNANRKLIKEKEIYSQKVEETLNMIQKVKNIEIQLRGMLGMKNARGIIENYPIGGFQVAAENPNLSIIKGNPSNAEKNLFHANINEVKRLSWQQKQSIKNINSFILKKKDVLLSTPSIWPVFGYITSGYGWRTHPISRRKEFHKALDIYSPLGKKAPVRSTAKGKIVFAGWAGGLGRTIIIDHGNGFSTRYAHCSTIVVKQSEEIQQGQIIGYIGSTGVSTGVHLHYEVWYRGKPVNPVRFVKGR